MSAPLPPLVRAILTTLLDRYEQPERQTVVRARLSEKAYPDYYARSDAGPRQTANQIFQQLADQGILHLHWQKWERGNWLTAVDLQPEQADALYALLQRTPRPLQTAALRDMLAVQTPAAAWFATFLAWAAQQLSQQRSPAPLNLTDPRWNADLLSALDTIAQLQHPTSERALSVRLFADSKRLAPLRSAIVAVLRRCDPQAAQFGDDDRALLQAHMLQRIPEYVPIAGPIVLHCATDADQPSLLDLAGFSAGLALPSTTLQTCQVPACHARAIITVENATSFHELLAVRPPDVLAIYIGGFASPATLHLLRAVREAAPALHWYHWGDLDPDGLRILAHLRSHLSDIQPLAMDSATLSHHHQHAQPLSARERSVLKQLRQHPRLADCHPLIDELLTTGTKLEQEAVTPPVARV